MINFTFIFYLFILRRNEYRLFSEIYEPSCNSEILNLDSVVHVDICSRQCTSNHANYFTNAAELTIRHYFNARDSSVIMAFDRIICLKRLVKLIIECYNFPFEQLIKLLSFTPNLKSLKFGSISCDTIDLIIIQQSDTFRCISKMNRITFLDVRQNWNLECMRMMNCLFPQL